MVCDGPVLICRSQWQYASIYNSSRQTNIKYRDVYLRLDEGTLTFNSEADVRKVLGQKI